MPLIFSPLSDEVVNRPPTVLLPKRAFIMRQIGKPPKIDANIHARVKSLLTQAGYKPIDATATTASKDYLERIIGLVRATGFTVAIFSEETRPDTMANIALELGFAAMSGKPLIICKSKGAAAPSDLKRTDWIEFDPAKPQDFARTMKKALSGLPELAKLEGDLLDVSLGARSIDCGIALERCNRGFLLTGQKAFIRTAEQVLERVNASSGDDSIGDLERLRSELKTFIRQATDAT